MKALLELVTDFDRAYSADKRRAGLVDFSDLEHLTAQLLTEEDGAPTELSQ
jgi:ATP-dependent helicase/nuclease subunit A